MKILRTYENCNTSFNARFPKADILGLVNIAKNDRTGAGIPKLYTLLDLLDNIPGKIASYKTETKTSRFIACGPGGPFYPTSTSHRLYVDDIEIKRGDGTKLDILHHAMTDYKTKEGQCISMPVSVWDNIWWKNINKTVEDIKKFFKN